MSQPSASTLLKQGIAAAKAGDKPLARQYLLQVIKLQPNNELPWLWLAITAGSPAEQIGYLQQALAVNPNNRRTATALHKLQAKKPSVKAKHEVKWPSPAQPVKPAVSPKLPAAKPLATRPPVVKPPTTKVKPPAAKPPVSAPPPLAWRCPLCQSPAPKQQDVCPACHAVLASDQVEAALANKNADRTLLVEAVHRLKNNSSNNRERSEELYWLGIAYLNLGQLDTAVSHIQAALQLQPQEKTWRQLRDQLSQRRQVEKKRTSPPAKPKRGTVMIVDDSPTICKLVGTTLKRQGYEVTVAVDGMNALAKLNDNLPDLILLDITMPRIDGYQLCKIVKDNSKTKHIPVVMLSGKDGFFDKVRGRMAGSTDYITKPFEPQELVKTVRQHMQLT